MNELIHINYDNPEQPMVSGRELHEFLGVDTPYTIWFARMAEYGFSKSQDYVTKMLDRSDGLPGKGKTDHALTVPMAKELCMIQRNEKGKQARQYFLAVEEQWNSPDAIMQRALAIANARVAKLRGETLELKAANSQLAVQNQIMAPKAEYFDQLVDRNLLTNFRETAKELGVKERVFVSYLLEKKYIYRDKRGKLMPTAEKNDGLFEIKKCFNEKTQWSGTQTLITPKGREVFGALCLGL